MHHRRWIITALAVMMTIPAVASAEYPVRFVDRPLTHPAGLFAVEAFGALVRFDDSSVGVTTGLGGRYGVTDDLELQAIVLPLPIYPDAKYGNPSAAVTYRLLRGNFELGAALGATIPVEGDFRARAFVPVLVRASPLRIDTGAALELSFGDPLGKALTLPLAAYLQVTDAFALGPRVALSTDFDTAVFALGGGALYAFGAFDVEATFILDDFKTAIAGLNLRVYL